MFKFQVGKQYFCWCWETTTGIRAHGHWHTQRSLWGDCLWVNVVVTNYVLWVFLLAPCGSCPFVEKYCLYCNYEGWFHLQRIQKPEFTNWGLWWDKHRYRKPAFRNFIATWRSHVIQVHDQRTHLTDESRDLFRHFFVSFFSILFYCIFLAVSPWWAENQEK